MFSIQQFTELPDQHFFPGYDSELVHALLCSALLSLLFLSTDTRTDISDVVILQGHKYFSYGGERSRMWFTWENPLVFSSTSHGNDS